MTFLLTDIVGSTRLWETAPAAVAGALPVHHRLIEELQRAAAENPGIPAFRAVLAQAYCELDRFDDARQLFDRDAAGDFGDYVYDCTWLCSAVLLADVCARISDSTRAPVLYERLAPWRDQVAFSGASVYGSVAHYLGQLAGTAGHYDTADSDFAEAARRHEEMGAVTIPGPDAPGLGPHAGPPGCPG